MADSPFVANQPSVIGASEYSDAFMLPTGTVTFLLTDVEHSTRSWEAAPEAMAKAINRHYEILGDVVGRHRGVRPVEQGEGDSIVAAFSRGIDAVTAALEAQQRLLAPKHGPTTPRSRCAWRCTRATRSCATRSTTSGKRSFAPLACVRSPRAVRCSSSRATHDLVAESLPDRRVVARSRAAPAQGPRPSRTRLPTVSRRPARRLRAAARSRRIAQQPARATHHVHRA